MVDVSPGVGFGQEPRRDEPAGRGEDGDGDDGTT
jgi:hypothetical protein